MNFNCEVIFLFVLLIFIFRVLNQQEYNTKKLYSTKICCCFFYLCCLYCVNCMYVYVAVF